MLRIKDLSFSYTTKKTVLNQLNLTLSENNIHGIIGINGAGKTTLLNCVAQYLTSYIGSIHLFDQSVKSSDVAFLETTPFFYPYLSGEDFLKLFHFKSNTLSDIGHLLNLDLKKGIETYSTGMKKKLCLISILSLNRPIIILDEPFNGLDLESTHLIELLIKQLGAQQRIILLTSHILDTLTNTCNYIHVLENGTTNKTYEPQEYASLKTQFSDQNKQKVEQLKEIIGI